MSGWEQEQADWKNKVRNLELRLEAANHRVRELEGIINRANKRLQICLDTLKTIPVVPD